MLVELARVTTSDGMRLDGAYLAPLADVSANAPPQRPLPCDAALVVHGTGSNFYGSTLLEALAEGLRQGGAASLVINTRGHDLCSTAATADGPVKQGATYEIVSDCTYDLTAWTRWLLERGHRRLALVGHSLGALKSIYALSEGLLPEVQYLVAISPPRLSYTRFSASSRREEFQRDLSTAEALVAAGQGGELMQIRFPLPYTITAAGYVDKYGRAERYHIAPRLARIEIPSLAIYGSLELQRNPAFEGLADELEQLDPERRRLQVDVIAEADHFYTGMRDALVARLLRWLRRQTG